MPRRVKCRRICAMPDQAGFLPIGGDKNGEAVVLTLDEYEVIRLIDRLHLTQEECAGQMSVARTTVTNIYESARTKLAASLVEQRPLLIRGGEVRLCEHAGKCCGRGCIKHCFGDRTSPCADGCPTTCPQAELHKNEKAVES